ncbi:MAG: hypothetical protein HC883_05640 [Bdellovibrionaceae bacterium]|nr:hypothetical protein [Pseudobdellovibrionaceae bacterium]
MVRSHVARKKIFLTRFSSLYLMAQKVGAIDPVNSAVEQAQALAMKKNRVEACAILRRTLEGLPANAKSRAKVADSLSQLSKIFFTDKGQKIFEAAQASMWDNPDFALAQFRESLALEDQNVLVLSSLARVQLLKQDCDGALDSVQAARKINPLSSEAALLELRAFVCKQSFELLLEKVKTLPPLGKWEESYVQYLLAQEALQQKAFRKVFDSMTKMTEEQSQFPEAFYLLSKASAELGKDAEAPLHKYVSLCKAVTVREKKRFSLEPRLCANQKEAEDELATNKTN